MTVPRHLSAYPVPFQTSLSRESARNTGVRSNCHVGPHDAHPKIRNRVAFCPGTPDRDLKPFISALATHQWPSAAH